MLTLEACVAVCIILLLIITFLHQRMKNSAMKETLQIPGPKPVTDIEGNLDEIKSCGSLHQFLDKYHQQYGPIIAFWFGPKQCISIASSKLFQDHASYFDRPAELFQGILPIMGEDTLTVVNGDSGRRRHSAYSKSLNPTSIKKFNTLFNKLGKQLVEKWMMCPEDQHIFVQEEMFNLAIKSILEALCGEELENNELIVNIRSAYQFCWSETEKYMMGDNPQPASSREAEFKRKKKTLDDLILGILSNRRQMVRSEEDILPIDVVLELRLPESTAVSDMLTLFIGGFHTTALLLTWSIYFLATYQKVQNKIRAELCAVLGTSTEMTTEMVNKMKYLNQVLKETLRVSRIGTFAARVHHSDILLGGYRVPAETPVLHALGLSLYDKEAFPEPFKFDPDRFSPENEVKLPPFSFEPFGFGGKRKCPGYNFAYAEATVYLSLLIRSFRIELAYEQTAKSKFGFVTKIADDLWVRARPI